MSIPSINYRLQHEFVSRGYDRKTCWVHPRAGAIPAQEPGQNPTVVLTKNKLLLSGSDVFYALTSTRSDDLGKSWTAPEEQQEFHRVRITDDGEVEGASTSLIEKIVCDFSPQWHAASGTLLGTGHTAYYEDNSIMQKRPRQTAYSAYDTKTRSWNAWQTLEMPGEKFHNAGAGSVQRFDLPNGEILLPIYYLGSDGQLGSTVVRCSFDGETLRYLEHGTELSHASGRGLYEPSITQFGVRFFLTMRNDLCGYVATSDDGLHFGEPKIWRFDDGEELGNYNTQQHWVTHSSALFLVYTRRGLNNDHVFRHRAPLVMAQVDPATQRVLRATERVIVPERGARLGNFGITQVSENETWVTVSEWMQTRAPNSYDSTVCERYGSDNSIWIARLLWDD